MILVLPAWSSSVIGNTGNLCGRLRVCKGVCVCVYVCVHACAGTTAISDRLGWVTYIINDMVLDNKPESLSQAGATISASGPGEVLEPELPQGLWVIP